MHNSDPCEILGQNQILDLLQIIDLLQKFLNLRDPLDSRHPRTAALITSRNFYQTLFFHLPIKLIWSINL